MEREVKILHIDPDYQGKMITIQKGKLHHFPISLQQTLEVVKLGTFDLIVSEPHHVAVLPPDKNRMMPLE